MCRERGCVGKVRKDINLKKKKKSVRHTCQTERSRLTVNVNISLIVAGLPLNGTNSNNCKHLGGLQALHLDPRGSSPGTGGPVQHKSRSERGGGLSLVTPEGRGNWNPVRQFYINHQDRLTGQ